MGGHVSHRALVEGHGGTIKELIFILFRGFWGLNSGYLLPPEPSCQSPAKFQDCLVWCTVGLFPGPWAAASEKWLLLPSPSSCHHACVGGGSSGKGGSTSHVHWQEEGSPAKVQAPQWPGSLRGKKSACALPRELQPLWS